MKLYELTEQMQGLQSLIDEGELDPVILEDTMEGLQTDLMVKGKDVLLFLANLDGDIKAFDDEIKRMTARKKTLVYSHAWLKDYLRINMIECGISKIESPIFTATLRKATKMVEITDESSLPVEYQQLVPATWKILKQAIAKDLKAGVEIPGATLIDGKQALLIK